jgi:hypothetical protein
VALIDEHESTKFSSATLEAREYQREGYKVLEPWVTTIVDAVSTETGKRLAAAAPERSPSVWWEQFAAAVRPSAE